MSPRACDEDTRDDHLDTHYQSFIEELNGRSFAQLQEFAQKCLFLPFVDRMDQLSFIKLLYRIDAALQHMGRRAFDLPACTSSSDLSDGIGDGRSYYELVLGHIIECGVVKECIPSVYVMYRAMYTIAGQVCLVCLQWQSFQWIIPIFDLIPFSFAAAVCVSQRRRRKSIGRHTDVQSCGISIGNVPSLPTKSVPSHVLCMCISGEFVISFII